MRTDLFLNGAWVATGDRVPVRDPSDGSTIAHIAVASEAQLDQAVQAATDAAAEFAALPPRVRAEQLRRAFELMIAEEEELARLVTRENGKVYADALTEVRYAAEFFRWFAEEAVRVAGDFRPSPAGDKTIIVTHQPVGVSLLVTPWNFPAAMATRKLGPALAAGCTVVLKPATETPLTTLAIADILARAGVPDGVVNVVMTPRSGPAVAYLLADPRVRNLSFTGSTEVGRILLRECATRVVRSSMELGGNAPFVVLDDADLDAAVAGAMAAKMRNGGAACTAANRFIVAESVVDAFTERFTAAMAALRMSPGLEPGAELGASVSLKERDKIAVLVDAARAAGAVVHTGGQTPAGSGAFYPPTVLRVARDNPILDHEIFGPVAPIIACASDDDAVALANATEFGLIGYVYGNELGRTLGVARRIDAGMVAINRGVISDPAAPFGGMKQSGLGREGGFAGIHEFLETKYLGVTL